MLIYSFGFCVFHLIKNTTLLSQECSGKLITWDRVYVGFYYYNILLLYTTTTTTSPTTMRLTGKYTITICCVV